MVIPYVLASHRRTDVGAGTDVATNRGKRSIAPALCSSLRRAGRLVGGTTCHAFRQRRPIRSRKFIFTRVGKTSDKRLPGPHRHAERRLRRPLKSGLCSIASTFARAVVRHARLSRRTTYFKAVSQDKTRRVKAPPPRRELIFIMKARYKMIFPKAARGTHNPPRRQLNTAACFGAIRRKTRR
jgi:hypothetical protein